MYCAFPAERVLRHPLYHKMEFAKFSMRLVTRSDFDGLVCGALLLEAGVIDHWKFAHPKDLQDGLVEINADDCLANVIFLILKN